MESLELESPNYEHVFQVGKLYQVYARKKWIIAEYQKMVPAHSERYSNVYFGKHQLDFGPEKTRMVPDTHYWKSVVGRYDYSTVAKDTQTRPVTDETLEEITRLKAEIKQCDLTRVALLDELKELTL